MHRVVKVWAAFVLVTASKQGPAVPAVTGKTDKGDSKGL